MKELKDLQSEKLKNTEYQTYEKAQMQQDPASEFLEGLVFKDKTDYYLKFFPENRVTVAEVFFIKTILDDTEKYNLSDSTKYMLKVLPKMLKTDKYIKTKAVARCLPGDTYTCDTGEQIAICKADIKYYNKRINEIKKYIKTLSKIIDELKTVQTFYCDTADKLNKQYTAIGEIND